MVPFIKLPLWGKSVLLIDLFLLLIAQTIGIYLTTRGGRTRKKVLLLIQTAVTILILSILAEGNTELTAQQNLSKSAMYGMRIPVVLLCLYEGISLAYILKIILMEYRSQKLEINKSTIKESADTLPMGLCFARLNGHPYLVNEKMNELSNLLRGRSLQNEESFWNDLIKGEFLSGAQRISSDDNPIVLLADGTVWVFRQEVIQIHGQNAIQMIATDSTQLYELYDKLQVKNHDLEIMNQKLKEYGNQIEGLTKTQERLSLKVRIHDAIGQNLIATKYFLLQGHRESDIELILKKWEQSVSMLRHEVQEEEERNALQYLTDAAQSAGVEILLEGQVPRSTRVQEMIVAAGAEALTNAVRHARADKLWITISEISDSYIIDFKNEKNKNHDIQEGGGLSSLRKRLEGIGASMEIITDTDFILKIIVPKTERGEFL